MNMRRLAVVVWIVIFGGTVVAQDSVVQTFSGSGGRNTRPFEVKDGWEIQWDAKGGLFQLFLYTASGDVEGVPANQQGPGVGASYQAKGGQYYLQVNAIGSWTTKIVQTAKPTPDPSEADKRSQTPSSLIASFSGSGGRNTRPFAAPGPWDIQWDAKGSIFQLFLYTEKGALEGFPANQQGPGEGSSYQPKAGTYYLQVNAIGEWTINIVPVK